MNSSGLKLIEEDYIEATLGYIHPDLAKQIRAFTKEGGPLDNNIPNLSKKLNRKVFLKCILEEIYKTPILKNARRDGLDLFHPRIVTRHAKKATKTTKAVEEKSDSLTKTKIRNAYSSVKRSFEELEKIFNENWNIHDSKYLLTNEIVFASAYIRHVKPKASDPFDGKQRGKLSKWMFLSMINKPTTGGSTLPMTEAACKVMRKPNPWTNLPNALKKNNIPLKPTLRVDHFGSHDRDEADSILKENSTIFALILCHNNLNKCTDVVDKTSLSGSNLNLDHFYAKKQMKKTKTKGHFDFLWDHAANKIWLNSGTNKWKNAKWPTEIKKGEIHTGSGHNTKKFDQTVKDNLTHQALPDKSVKVEKKHLFSGGKVVPKYIKFLEFRVKNLVKQLNKTLDHMDKNGF